MCIRDRLYPEGINWNYTITVVMDIIFFESLQVSGIMYIFVCRELAVTFRSYNNAYKNFIHTFNKENTALFQLYLEEYRLLHGNLTKTIRDLNKAFGNSVAALYLIVLTKVLIDLYHFHVFATKRIQINFLFIGIACHKFFTIFGIAFVADQLYVEVSVQAVAINL